MARKFQVPEFYRSELISAIKAMRTSADPRRQDLSPTLLDFGAFQLKIARHFGFCFGVENAIEIAYRALSEQGGRRIFLLSEMIHNPGVNADLRQRGVEFLMDTSGHSLIPFEALNKEDIVIVPAFGTTLEIQQELSARGIDPYYYDTTCPFVEKVWKRSSELGARGFSVVIHGKRAHEETRATFSHSKNSAPTLVVRDLSHAKVLAQIIAQELPLEAFRKHFEGYTSDDFDPNKHLERIGVVNQTTMLATETKAIASSLRDAMVKRFGAASIKQHFADTRDTLCYATYENQSATHALIASGADLVLVVGGYNSSNTSHIVELCAEKFPTYYIKDRGELLSGDAICHFELETKAVTTSTNWLPVAPNTDRPLIVAITSGASCPDSTVEGVIERILELVPGSHSKESVLWALKANNSESLPSPKPHSTTAAH